MHYLKNNASLALYAENIETVVNVWNQYAGKRCGEKTAQKIRDEIKAKTGCYFWVGSGHDGFSLTHAAGTKVSAHTLQRDKKILGDTIQAVSVSDFAVSYIRRDYVENIPAEIKKAKRLYKAARAAQEKLEKACAAYRAVAVDGMPEANPRGTIYDRL